jgi:hypothetical protein
MNLSTCKYNQIEPCVRDLLIIDISHVQFKITVGLFKIQTMTYRSRISQYCIIDCYNAAQCMGEIDLRIVHWSGLSHSTVQCTGQFTTVLHERLLQ